MRYLRGDWAFCWELGGAQASGSILEGFSHKFTTPAGSIDILQGQGSGLLSFFLCTSYSYKHLQSTTMEDTKPSGRKVDNALARSDIEALIAEGRQIVLVDGKVLKVDAWLPFHPGGSKAILHMVGRDATNEVRAFHSEETQRIMLRYQIGTFEGQWLDFVPPIQGGVFRKREESMSVAPTKENPTSNEGNPYSDANSSASSPLSEPADSRASSVRQRKGSSGNLSQSSATSLSSMELEEVQRKKESSPLP
jgi:sphingolipid 8-(E)-desaturase